MKLFLRLKQEFKNLIYKLRSGVSKNLKKHVDLEVLYVCQFARPEHAELSLKKKLLPINDPFWKETGALSPQRYAQWAFTMCGMASTAMALHHFKKVQIPPVLLAEDAMKAGVYVDEGGVISSMRYREFTSWIKKHGISADAYSKLNLKGIQHALSNGKLVIISVNPNIRGYNTAPVDQKGGHLVLVTGYDREGRTITINNPSGFVSTNTQIRHRLSLENFNRYYAGRGIILRYN